MPKTPEEEIIRYETFSKKLENKKEELLNKNYKLANNLQKSVEQDDKKQEEKILREKRLLDEQYKALWYQYEGSKLPIKKRELTQPQEASQTRTGISFDDKSFLDIDLSSTSSSSPWSEKKQQSNWQQEQERNSRDKSNHWDSKFENKDENCLIQ